jgi:dTDP-4-amino-4,6-dideoxygalactose transaminase
LQKLANSGLVLPFVPAWAEPVWHLFVVRSSERDHLQARLNQQGIGTLIHYPIPPHLSGAYATDFQGQQFGISEKLAASVLSLPMGPHLSPVQQESVISALLIQGKH